MNTQLFRSSLKFNRFLSSSNQGRKGQRTHLVSHTFLVGGFRAGQAQIELEVLAKFTESKSRPKIG
jgi:hypothetical protein